MFEVVARANIHHQQVVKLLKQRKKVHQTLLYEQGRITTLEQSLCAHIYALQDAEPDILKAEVTVLVDALNILTDDQLTSEQLINSYEQQTTAGQANELAKAIELLCSLLPAGYFEKKLKIEFENNFLEDILYRNSQLLELLIHFNIAWPIEPLQVVRQSALAAKFSPSLTVACLLFGQSNVSTQELAQGYQHPLFSIAQASFIKGLAIDKTNAQIALFNRFAKTTDVAEKAELLTIAGLSGDNRWLEPCAIFCQEYPQYTFTVLSHFQHKSSLTLVIELMAVAQTSEQAYQAWLLLTHTKLLKKPQLQDSHNKQRQAGELTIPNIEQAELSRQALMVQAGTKVLAGILFDDLNALEKLSGLQGQAVQRALVLSHSTESGMLLYCQQLSSTSFIKTVRQQGGQNVT
ncbi:hypothetical protein KO495_13820 [Colwellia sp. D2M02]|uniref:hypothetical protein n=1 Tax=Colwellia sp. D2M02 TaxID=2841562 RepID=UPI001C0A62AE|nr:hypothetical protein [Colwellia sp. D2M02]MBU2894388.1 hypothetical protein [Colwellia sp. D2M02]